MYNIALNLLNIYFFSHYIIIFWIFNYILSWKSMKKEEFVLTFLMPLRMKKVLPLGGLGKKGLPALPNLSYVVRLARSRFRSCF